MDRRDLLKKATGVIGAGGVMMASTGMGASSLSSSSAVKTNVRDALDACISSCLDCFRSCMGEVDAIDCSNSAFDCMEVCKALRSLLSGDSPLVSELAAVCVEACLRCAEACEAHSGDPECVDCAAACRECARLVQELV